ncbi:MAG TPA: C45 family peptidase [Clostridia bacterium]|nr:C45 family peptidase [Clostridia bacterium]
MNILKKWRFWRYLFLVFLGFVVLAGAGVLALLWVRPQPTLITLAGSSQEMGADYGSKAKWQLKLLNDLYLERTICRNDRQLIQARRKAAVTQTTNWPEPYVREISAMASASGLPTGALAYANCFLDLGAARAGCRSVVAGSNGVFLHAHNLDWDSLAGLGRWTTCIVRRAPSDGRFKTVSIGFPGLIGSFDIINEKGLAISFNQLGMSNGSTNEPVFIMIRRIAESCGTLAAARREILSAPPGMPFILTVSDSSMQEGSVFERTRGRIIERGMSRGWVAACNVSQEQQTGSTGLDKVLGERPISQLRDLQEILGDERVMLGCNLYSVIFDFKNNRMLLASGSVPAASASYREFVLFER